VHRNRFDPAPIPAGPVPIIGAIMRTKLAVLISLLIPLGLLAPATATATTSTAAYDFHIADPFLHDAVGSPLGATATADNGDTLTIIGSGQLDAGANTASGSGTFVHHETATGADITGTWVATSLISFQFYGCGGGGLPDFLCGGLAKLNLVATPDANPALHIASVVWITCELGTQVPPSATEGVRVLAKDFINFNKTVPSGFTVFVKH
jgi:hypothetical protein